MPDFNYKQLGLTLLEMAIAIVIVGIMLAGALKLYNSAANQQKERETRQRMDQIVKALGQYVEAANRLPCPADPSVGKSYVIAGQSQEAAFGWERGVKAQDLKITGARPVGTCNTHDDPRNREGIVPYATLNIPYEMTRDGWGNYFTYAVSPVFAMRTDLADTGERDDNVHARCREVGWVIGSDPSNAPKARFCCAQYIKPPAVPVDKLFLPDTDLRIQLASDIGAIAKDISPKRDNPNFGPGGNYEFGLGTRLMDTASPQQQFPKTYSGNIEAPAFILISHGRNGEGAYIDSDEPPAKRNIGFIASTAERQNADLSATATPEDARLYYTGRQKFSGADYFDDIVVWMTQDQIMAYNGTSSCRYP